MSTAAKQESVQLDGVPPGHALGVGQHAEDTLVICTLYSAADVHATFGAHWYGLLGHCFRKASLQQSPSAASQLSNEMKLQS